MRYVYRLYKPIRNFNIPLTKALGLAYIKSETFKSFQKRNTSKQERKKETKLHGTKQKGLEIKARLRSYLLQCVKKIYYFKNSSKPCNSSGLLYDDKFIIIDYFSVTLTLKIPNKK
jgi:hypothetical protein